MPSKTEVVDRVMRVDAYKKRQLLCLPFWGKLTVPIEEQAVWRVIASKLKRAGVAVFTTEKVGKELHIWRIW
jgi:hypothetical protein